MRCKNNKHNKFVADCEFHLRSGYGCHLHTYTHTNIVILSQLCRRATFYSIHLNIKQLLLLYTVNEGFHTQTHIIFKTHPYIIHTQYWSTARRSTRTHKGSVKNSHFLMNFAFVDFLISCGYKIQQQQEHHCLFTK